MKLAILGLLIAVPLAEIAALIEVGGLIGGWPTVGAVAATAALGAWLVRLQGLAVLRRARASLAADRVPIREMFDGVCLLVAGVLLLIPGFATDAAGLLLLVPALRGLLALRLAHRIAARRRAGGGAIEAVWRETGPEPPDAPGGGGRLPPGRR